MKKALKSILSITLCLIMLLGTISGTFMRFCDIIKNPFSLSHPQNRVTGGCLFFPLNIFSFPLKKTGRFSLFLGDFEGN